MLLHPGQRVQCLRIADPTQSGGGTPTHVAILGSLERGYERPDSEWIAESAEGDSGTPAYTFLVSIERGDDWTNAPLVTEPAQRVSDRSAHSGILVLEHGE